MKAPWPTVAIIGVGLIGGSIGAALLTRKLARRVIGIGRTKTSLREASRRKLVSETSLDIMSSVSEADLVIVATSLSTISATLEAIDAFVRPGTLLTDVGSTKVRIVAEWERHRNVHRGCFVGAHPLAGSHLQGPSAATADLFIGRTTVVTPSRATPTANVEAVCDFWSALGSTVFVMPPRQHDRILACTSHTPHAIAAALASATPHGVQQFTAGGWRDTTRIASGDPDLWADILLDNGPEVAKSLARVATITEKILSAIKAGDRRRLITILTHAKEIRDAVGG